MSEIVQNDSSYKSEIIDCESAKQRFERNLPRKPYCTDDLTYGLKIRPREKALRCAYIQLNQKLRFYLSFDIDRAGAAFAYEDAGLPAPTIIIVNPQNAHAHLLYELSLPVAFKDRNGNGHARNAPMKFYEALYRGMVEKLDGDRGYVGLICKNPWHSRWETIWHDSAVYTLGELTDYVDPIWKAVEKTEEQEEDHFDPEMTVYRGNRNDFLFRVARMYAYKQVRHIVSFDALYGKILEHIEQVNRSQLIPPLSQSDVKAKAKCVAKYCIKNRTSILNYGDRNRGVMNLDKIRYPLEKQDLKNEIRHRQHLGAEYTASMKRERTEAKIIEAIAELKKSNQRITKTKVAENIGMNVRTIRENYKHLFLEL